MFDASVSTMSKALPVAAPAFAVLLLSGCGTFYSDASPDVIYSTNAQTARDLQVPPDLTDVSDGEQFVVPGTERGAVARNTLLPVFDNVELVREGDAAWLEFDATPENLWSQLLAFARKEKYRIDETEPTAGTIFTQWRSASAVGESSLLGNLIGGGEYSRLGFRLERRLSGGTRLFARRQQANESVAKGNAAVPWPAVKGNPEQTSELLARLLVFLGINEQRARGVMSAAQAASALDSVSLSTGAAGSLLVVNRGYEPAFQAVGKALASLDLEVTSVDDSVGRIEYLVDGETRVLSLLPVHVSAVRVSLSDAGGRRLSSERERDALESLRNALLA